MKCPFLGFPDSPLNLSHNPSLNTKSSALIQWKSPLYRGGDGISVNFSVLANGETTLVNSGSDVVTYNITGLQYNVDYSVEVTAINSCGLESDPATVHVNIDARG